METLTDIHSLVVNKPNSLINLTTLEFESFDMENYTPGDNVGATADSYNLDCISEGLWKTCLLPNGMYVCCKDNIFRCFEDMDNFRSFVEKEHVINSQEELMHTRECFEAIKKDCEISREIINDYNLKLIFENKSSDFISITFSEKPLGGLTTEQLKAIESNVECIPFSRRITETSTRSFLYSILVDKDVDDLKRINAFAMVNDFGEICAIFLSMFNLENNLELEGEFFDGYKDDTDDEVDSTMEDELDFLRKIRRK